jgi:hypothetical protein
MKTSWIWAGVALALGLATARAADPPELREGLWEIKGQSVENPGNNQIQFTYRLCRNHAFDKAMNKMVKDVKGCTTEFKSLGGGRFASASRCSMQGTVIVSKGTYTYESATATRSESSATYDPPLRGKTDESVVEDQSYVGECPAGVNPGDRIMADGRVQRYRR